MDQRDDTDQFDEYLWPLAGAPWELRLTELAPQDGRRRRLEEIYQHVQEHHVQPRLRRLGKNPSAALVDQVTETIVEGATGAPLWERRLKEPVPRALRDEWRALCDELQREAEAASSGDEQRDVSR